MPYYRDVLDHVIRALELLDNVRDLLTSARELQLAQVSNRLNVVMKQLSAWAAIILIPTLIAGIYGMNFEHMPELGWFFGYPFALAVMAAAAFVLYRMFREASVALMRVYRAPRAVRRRGRRRADRAEARGGLRGVGARARRDGRGRGSAAAARGAVHVVVVFGPFEAFVRRALERSPRSGSWRIAGCRGRAWSSPRSRTCGARSSAGRVSERVEA